MHPQRERAHRWWLIALAIVGLVWVSPSRADAQAVPFKLVEADGQVPLAGVLVSELDARGASGPAVLSTASGIASLDLRGATSVRLLVRRIGFAPTIVGPIAVPDNRGEPILVVVSRLTPVTLSTVRVTAPPSCGAKVQSPAEGARDAWTAVRTAVEASRLTRTQRLVTTAAVTLERWVPLDGTPGRTDTTGRGVSGERPFVSPPVAELERYGYVRPRDDGSVDFYAPDEDVLLSNGFTHDHCIYLSAARRDSAGAMIALAFLPRDNDGHPEIRGLIWIDSATSELRRVQFQYVHMPISLVDSSLGGAVDFAHLASGAWIISDWMLRLPHFSARTGPFLAERRAMDAYVEVGGHATPIRDVQIPAPGTPRRIAGLVYDSLANRPAAGARVHLSDLSRDELTDSAGRFAFDSVPTGRHTILVDYPPYDSLGVSPLGARVDVTPTLITNVLFAVPSFATMWNRLCAPASAPTVTGTIIFGTASAGDASPAPRVAARVRWRDASASDSSGRSGQVQSDSSGAFAICGVPGAARVVLSATAGDDVSRDTLVRSGTGRVVRLDLPLLPKAALAVLAADSARGTGVGRYRLRVRSDQGDPIQYASVDFNGGSVHTSDQFGEVALGAQRPKPMTATVRRIGYEPWAGAVNFADTATVISVSLKPTAQTLGAVRIGAKRSPISPFVQGFYDRWEQAQKGALSGTFIGPEEMEFRHPARLTEMLEGLNGVKLICDMAADCSVQSTRQGSMQMGSGCPMAIVLDGKQIYGSVNINELINVNDVMAIEVYARAGNTPISMQFNDTKCGLVAFWTGSRR